MRAGDVFYYADEFTLNWLPDLRAMWSPKGQQVMISTPRQNRKWFGIGAVNYYTGETVVLFRPHKWRQDILQLLENLLEKHPVGRVFLVWDNVSTHWGTLIDDFVVATDGRLVLLYLPTYSPWLNPIERLWREFRRQVTHCELFQSLHDLVEAAKTCFRRWNAMPQFVRSLLGHLSV